MPPVLADGFRGVFLVDLVVEERGRVRRRHEAPVHLWVHADVLVDLAGRHLHFERARGLVVADRAQLRGIDALALHQARSTRIWSPAFTFFNTEWFSRKPRTLHGFASLGRWSVEIGVRP